jgi:CHASE3 domain sensor protein
MKTILFRKLLWPGLFVIIILMNALAVYSVYKSNQRVRIAEQLVDHTQQVINKTENIFSIGKGIENTLKAFVITNDSVNLAPFFATEKPAFEYIVELKELEIDNPVQQSRVDSLSL